MVLLHVELIDIAKIVLREVILRVDCLFLSFKANQMSADKDNVIFFNVRQSWRDATLEFQTSIQIGPFARRCQHLKKPT